MSVTSASDIEATSTMESTVASLKSLTAPELFKLMKLVASEAEKKTKTTAKATARAPKQTKPKAGSMPKGTIPRQLLKPRAWVEYTLKDALENGWESFTIHQTHKDKMTGEKTEEEIEMPASILHDGAHVFEGSVTEANPTGRQLIHKEAMSLSKQRKTTNHPSYAAFEAQYVEETPATESSESESSSTSSKVVKKTAAEKEAEKEAKKAAKEAEKAAAKAAKEAEKEAKKAEKEAEKAAAKAAKEAEKAAKKTEKTSPKLVPAAAVKKVVPATAAPAKPAEAKPTEAKTSPAPKKVAKPVTKVEAIPDDGMVHPWTYKGKKYLRNFEGETWTVGADGGVGVWTGLYDSASDKLDTSAPEPVFEEDDE